jgi:CP family cyanate transporter-like MFS transporter
MLMAFPLVALLLWLPQWRQKHVATVTGAGALHNAPSGARPSPGR